VLDHSAHNHNDAASAGDKTGRSTESRDELRHRLADLIGRLLAHHWLRQRGLEGLKSSEDEVDEHG
jgi:hypothetical protein